MYLTSRIPSRIECRIPDILLLQVLEYGSVSDQLLEASGHSSLSGSGSGRFFREPSPTLTDAGRFMGDVYSFGMIVWEVLSTQVQCVVVDFPKRDSRFEKNSLLRGFGTPLHTRPACRDANVYGHTTSAMH